MADILSIWESSPQGMADISFIWMSYQSVISFAVKNDWRGNKTVKRANNGKKFRHSPCNIIKWMIWYECKKREWNTWWQLGDREDKQGFTKKKYQKTIKKQICKPFLVAFVYSFRPVFSSIFIITCFQLALLNLKMISNRRWQIKGRKHSKKYPDAHNHTFFMGILLHLLF